MFKTFLFAAVALSLIGLSLGCSYARAPASYMLYADVSSGQLVNAGELPESPKVGEATAQSIIGITTGDCSIDAAVKNGGITKINWVDYHSKGILGVWAQTTTKVYGE